MDNVKESFVAETEQLIDLFEQRLILFDENPEDAETLDAMFRTLHSIKGSASMFGFNTMADAAHSLENFVSDIKQKKQKPGAEFTQLCFDFSDYVRKLFAASENETAELDSQIVEKISKKAEYKKVTTQIKNTQTWQLIFKPNADFDTRGIDLFAFLEVMQACNPNTQLIEHSTAADLMSEKFYMFWEIYTTATSADSLSEGFFFDDDELFIHKIADFDCLADTDFLSLILQQTVDSHPISEEKLKHISEKKVEVTPVSQVKDSTLFMTTGNSSQIFVNARRLDELMNFVSELVTLKETVNIIAEHKDISKIKDIAEKFERITRKIQDNALSMRLVPLRNILPKLEVMVKRLSKQQQKRIIFETDGADTELDKTIIDNLSEPLMHILRNSIDHGIELPYERTPKGKSETGHIKLLASYSGDTVIIQIHDDGRGIDAEKIRLKALEKGLISADQTLTKHDILNLIFAPGFSTAEHVSDLSGRGVGMDVVRTKIADLRGEIEVNSEQNLGTYITLKLPLTLSIVDTLQVKVGSNDYLIPKSGIAKVDELSTTEYKSLKNSIYYDNGTLLPLLNLKETFGNTEPDPEFLQIVTVSYKSKHFGLITDRIIGDHQAVLRPLGEMLRDKQHFAGASILGNGKLALMIDTNKLIKSQNLLM